MRELLVVLKNKRVFTVSLNIYTNALYLYIYITDTFFLTIYVCRNIKELRHFTEKHINISELRRYRISRLNIIYWRSVIRLQMHQL